jgi:hypothetical protein
VQELLKSSVYLGRAYLAAIQVFMRMTPELLAEPDSRHRHGPALKAVFARKPVSDEPRPSIGCNINC